MDPLRVFASRRLVARAHLVVAEAAPAMVVDVRAVAPDCAIVGDARVPPQVLWQRFEVQHRPADELVQAALAQAWTRAKECRNARATTVPRSWVADAACVVVQPPGVHQQRLQQGLRGPSLRSSY
eukprot:7015393-Alexandrium_andersonii.AAC.1